MIFTVGLFLFLVAGLAMMTDYVVDLSEFAFRAIFATFILGLGLMVVSVFAFGLPIIWMVMP